MSLMELFRSYATGNTGNTDEKTGVTSTDHGTQGGNTGNTGITEKNDTRGKTEIKQVLTGVRVYCYRVTDKPKSVLTAIMPNTTLDEAREVLTLKYGDRLTTVYENIVPVNLTRH